MVFQNRDILSIRDFSKQELLHVLSTAAAIEKNPATHSNLLRGNILASAFFEPSTRTRLSFEAAMHRLGGSVIGFSETASTSQAKGETMEDAIKVLDGYCDVIVMRHPEPHSAKRAAEVATHPVINTGDGANEHPTQTFVDLYTIQKSCGTLDGLNIGFIGDLKYGRTVHSLVHALAHFKTKLHFISSRSLRMPEQHLKELEAAGIACIEHDDLTKASKELDVLYVTRIQKERFMDPEEYVKAKATYRVEPSLLSSAKPSLKILHPLPRVDELDPRFDKEPQSVYFQQAHNGIPVRMALLGLVLGKMQ